MRLKYKLWIVMALALVLIGSYFVMTSSKTIVKQPDTAVAAAEPKTSGNELVDSAKAKAAWKQTFPIDQVFESVAETDTLKLSADPHTGHFIVENRKNGSVWRSFPNPQDWDKETITGLWRDNLRSPIMYETVDLTKLNLPPSGLGNIIDDGGYIKDWKKIDGGFHLTFSIPSKHLSIPVEVRIKNDYVETKIIDSEFKEDPKFSMINLRLYPFFGAEQSKGQDGYLFVPDGSGALVRFKADRINDNKVYNSKVYGTDFPLEHNADKVFKKSVTMPVFGMKSGDQGFVAVIHEGAEYASVYASPSGIYSQYNWITADMTYRMKYKHITSKSKDAKGFDTYNAVRFGSDRTVRYYLLDKGKSDYSAMASRFREYLIKEKNLKKIQTKSAKVPMFISILGGDSEKGLFGDRYVIGTKLSEATQMITRLYGLGIENMSISYLGWEQGGLSALGSHFPVDARIGGDIGMKQFVQFAHTLDIPVYLQTDYSLDNTGSGGFNPSRQGMRDLGQSVMYNTDLLHGALVSPRYQQQEIENDLPKYKELGVAGVSFGPGLGTYLNSDFNTDYAATRSESREIQQSLLSKTAETLGGAQVKNANLYALEHINRIYNLADDYSYDLFVDETIPFIQMALHGLINYSSEYSNQRQQYQQEFLRSIEYGANPSFVFSGATVKDLKDTHSFAQYFSSDVHDWEEIAVKEYQRYNDALGDVQDQFIVSNRTIADNVKETTYANGKKVIVNYNLDPYSDGAMQIPAQDFIVVNGGASQ